MRFMQRTCVQNVCRVQRCGIATISLLHHLLLILDSALACCSRINVLVTVWNAGNISVQMFSLDMTTLYKALLEDCNCHQQEEQHEVPSAQIQISTDSHDKQPGAAGAKQKPLHHHFILEHTLQTVTSYCSM